MKRRRESLIFILFLTFMGQIFAEDSSISQERDLKTSYLEIATSYGLSATSLKRMSDDSAWGERKPFDELEVGEHSEFTYEELLEYFKFVRDLHFLKDPRIQGVERRIPWFWPKNGCQHRATLMTKIIREVGEKRPLKKVFIFGNLSVKTKFDASGKIGWWFHVAPIAKVGEELYVIDPSIKFGRPLTLKEWTLAQVSNLKDAKVSICDVKTLEPRSHCERGSRTLTQVERTSGRSIWYQLKNERSNLETLGFDVDVYLGFKTPVWRIGHDVPVTPVAIE